MLDQAFETLKTYDWGMDRKALNPIDEAVIATREDAAARQDLAAQLAAILTTNVSRDAKDYVCRKLMVIGTAANVPALAGLLGQKESSHMARYALERIPAQEAGQALRDALPNLSSELAVGVIASLGVRGEAASVSALAGLLSAADASVASAAAYALGDIGGPQSAQALAGAKPTVETKAATTDASLKCAENLLSEGKKTEALAIYKRFVANDEPKHIRLAATRGMLACAGKSQ